MSLAFVRTILSYAAIGAALAANGVAQAAQPAKDTIDQLRRMGPEQARAWIARQVERQSAQRRIGAQGAVDTTPPVLTKFDSAVSVDVAAPFAAASFKASDDLSGVRWGGGYAIGPSGQELWVSFYNSFPQKKLAGVMHSYDERAYLEAGTYVFSWVYLYDVGGNYAFYDQTQLAALGNTSMTIKNKNGYDPLPPALTSGQVLTTNVSLWAKQPGTDVPAYLGASVQLNDAGATAVAGVQYVSAQFCLLDQSSCFWLFDGSTGRPGKPSAAIRLGGQIDPLTNVPGDYHLQSMYVSDFAGNYRSMNSVEFGGDIDFSTYFPSTTITITP